MNAFFAAIRLLTIVPLPPRQSSPGAIANSVAFFPIVGIGIGGAMALVNWLAGLALPALPVAALTVAAGVVVSGALHLDGLADTFDGVFGGRTPERRLEIMRDSSIGVFGVAAVVIVLLVKWSAIASFGTGSAWAAIILAPTLSRAAAAWVISTKSYVRAEGLGTPYRRGINAPTVIALLLSAIAAVVLLGPWALIGLAVAVGVGELSARYAAAKLGGGVTGDTYGACIELAEVATLICLLALLGSSLGVGFPFGG